MDDRLAHLLVLLLSDPELHLQMSELLASLLGGHRHTWWNVPSEARIEPPSQDEYILSAGDEGASVPPPSWSAFPPRKL